MENIGVTMVRDNMQDIPDFPFPKGFGVRCFRPGEGHIWTRIQRSAETFFEIGDDLFEREFGSNLAALEDRSFFAISDSGEEVGTITAWWYVDKQDKKWGLIHWVAVHPDYQGRGLAKATMSVVMNRLKQSHDCACLHTSSGRIAAIKVYLDFGFQPAFDRENSQKAWSELASVLDHPTLKKYNL